MDRLEELSSFEDINKLTTKDLKAILSHYNQSLSGKKADLIIRCCAILDEQLQENRSKESPQGSLLDICTNQKDLTYEKIIKETNSSTWTKDLRTLPEFHFIELYDYLVVKTQKYDHESVRTSGYKKLKAFQFFKEGHIKDLQVCSVGGTKYAKAEILASMKQGKYSAVVVFDHHGKVTKAACKCPAG